MDLADIQSLVASLPRDQREELQWVAARYVEYVFFRDLGKAPAGLERELLETLERIDGDSSAQRIMKAVWAHKVGQGSHSWIGPGGPRSGRIDRAVHLLERLKQGTPATSRPPLAEPEPSAGC